MFNDLLTPSFMVQFSSVQSLSRVRLFVTPWTAARQAYLSITNSRSLLRLMSIKLVMPSNHLMKEESEKVGLKLNSQKTKIMASSPITSWHIDGETTEAGGDFVLGGSRITAEGDCSPEIKRHLLIGRKAMTNLDSILKSRGITLPKKVCLLWYSCSHPLPVFLLA